MARTITINPITRISGFLEIQVEIEGHEIVDARNSGMLFRGFERMLAGRPPLDAIYYTERICGICSSAHSIASSMALEDILGIKMDEHNQMLKDITHGCEYIQNHLRHFYQFTLPDYVYGPEVNPLYTSEYNDFRLPDDLNRKLTDDYLESIQYSRLAHEMLATLGAKAPHNHGITVGGMTVNLDITKLVKVQSILASIKEFVIQKMIPDVCIIAEYYKDYFENGMGYPNLMTYGLYDSYAQKELFYVAPQVSIDGQRQPLDPDAITESINRSWYEGNKEFYLPTEPTPMDDIHKPDAYSWIKAPRYKGYPMEVGPLARMLLSGNYDGGISTMDRTVARVLEMKKIIECMESMLEKVKPQPANLGRPEFLHEASGRGMVDTTRGSLGHWVSVKDQLIDHYQIITPSAWNLSTEDSRGVKGVVEKALIGSTIEDVNSPVEIGRIVRSFDPCVSCGAHVYGLGISPVDLQIV